MITDREQQLLGSIRSDAGWRIVQTYAHTRRELPEEFERGAEILAQQLQALQLPVQQLRPDLYLGIPRSASIVCNGHSYRTKAAALSPNQEAFTAQLVHVPARDGAARSHTNDPALIFGEGHTRASLRAKVAGKVVVTEGLSNPGRSELLEALGARAIITINPGGDVHWGASSVVWGSPQLEELDRLPKIVSMAVNREEGTQLVAQAMQGASATIAADVLHGWFPQTITSVEIKADGPMADEFVLLHGHLDSWDLGVGDNATGNAVLLEVARALHAMRGQLQRSVRILWWPGHSAGRYAGSTWYADHHAFDLRSHCVAQVNCDSPGCKDASDYRSIRGMSEASALVAGAVADLFGQTCKLERPSRGGDYSFNNLGLSGALLTSSMVPPEERKRRGWYAVGGNGGSPTWHTENDVFEVADRTVLENDARLYALVVARLACAPTPQLDYRIPVADIVAQLDQARSLAGSCVDLQTHWALAGKLAALVGECYAPGTSAPRLQRWQELRAASRSIVRAGYVERGPFEQDPAFAKPALPTLSAASQLQTHPGAARVSLQRGANLLRAELEHAVQRLQCGD